MKKVIVIILILATAAGGFYYFQSQKHKGHQMHAAAIQTETEEQILYYTCGMHPSVRVSPQEYEQGNTKCPICFMDLTPVYSTPQSHSAMEMPQMSQVVSIKPSELALAGVETYQLKVVPLYKTMRTVGITAYDPGLRIAEEEYLQALATYRKVSQSGFPDAIARSKDIVEASQIKLQLLGLDENSIKDLEQQGQADKSLILPDDYMWIYAQFYEYEILWPKVGDKVKITLAADPSLILEGEVKAIEPLIKEKTRTEQLKISVANKERILKPNMYVDVWLETDLGSSLALPKAAVLDTGKRKVVYADLGQGRFQLREVSVGPLAQGKANGIEMDFYPLISGVDEGEAVVLKGNFLIDSQSQLGAAASAYSGSLGDDQAIPPGHQH